MRINSAIRKIIFLLLSVPALSYGSVCAGAENSNSNITLLFVNGILNSTEDSKNSAQSLANSLARNGFDVSKLNIQCHYNGTEGPYNDVIELRIQAAISSKAKTNDTTNSTEGYYKRLGAAYRGLLNGNTKCEDFLKYKDGFIASRIQVGTVVYETVSSANACKRVVSLVSSLRNDIKRYADRGGVIVAAHSQGNFYLEAAYSLLLEEGYENLNKIQGVGIAAISQNPINSRYVTISQDNAIYFAQTVNASFIENLNYSPAKSSFIACAQNLECSPDIGKGQNPSLIATLTKSVSIPSDVATKFAQYGINIPEDKKALLHELNEVYLSDKLLATGTSKTIPKIISDMFNDAYNELSPNNFYTISGNGLYSKLTFEKKPNGEYSLLEKLYRLSPDKKEWVQMPNFLNSTTSDPSSQEVTSVLLPSGQWWSIQYNITSAKFFSNGSFELKFNGYVIQNGEYFSLENESNYPAGSKRFSFSFTNEAELLYLYPLPYRTDAKSIDEMFSIHGARTNATDCTGYKFNNAGLIGFDSVYSWFFRNNTAEIFNKSDTQFQCADGLPGYRIADIAPLQRRVLPDGSDSIVILVPKTISLDLCCLSTWSIFESGVANPLYVVKPSENRVRLGWSRPAKSVSNSVKYNKTLFNFKMRERGLPEAVD